MRKLLAGVTALAFIVSLISHDVLAGKEKKPPAPKTGPGPANAAEVTHAMQRALASIGKAIQGAPATRASPDPAAKGHAVNLKSKRQHPFYKSLAGTVSAIDALHVAAGGKDEAAYRKALGTTLGAVERTSTAYGLSGLGDAGVKLAMAALSDGADILKRNYGPEQGRRHKGGAAAADETARNTALKALATKLGAALGEAETKAKALPKPDKKLIDELGDLKKLAEKAAGPPAAPKEEKGKKKKHAPEPALLDYLATVGRLETAAGRLAGLQAYYAKDKDREPLLAALAPLAAEADKLVGESRAAMPLAVTRLGEKIVLKQESWDKVAKIDVPADQIDALKGAAAGAAKRAPKAGASPASPKPPKKPKSPKPPLPPGTKKKLKAADLAKEMHEAVAYIGKLTRESPKPAKGAKPTPPAAGEKAKPGPQPLSPKIKDQKAFFSALGKFSKGLDDLEKKRAAKDKTFFKLLSDQGKLVQKVKLARQLSGLTDPRVVKGIKSLDTAFTLYEARYGKEAGRRKKGGPATDAEKAQLAKMKEKNKNLRDSLKKARAKVKTDTAAGRRIAKALDESIKQTDRIARGPRPRGSGTGGAGGGGAGGGVDPALLDLLSTMAALEELTADLAALQDISNSIGYTEYQLFWMEIQTSYTELNLSYEESFELMVVEDFSYFEMEFEVTSNVTEEFDLEITQEEIAISEEFIETEAQSQADSDAVDQDLDEAFDAFDDESLDDQVDDDSDIDDEVILEDDDGDIDDDDVAESEADDDDASDADGDDADEGDDADLEDDDADVSDDDADEDEGDDDDDYGDDDDGDVDDGDDDDDDGGDDDGGDDDGGDE